ncbi:MAG: hypothetical protein FGF51_03415 [Candidatus Brockarchaeota archaeon]|nr:hypothetical protein [Candidatus Brockarchaeota archaeon]
MVSWGRAFKAALVLLAFTILWSIIGGIIIIAGTFFGALGAVRMIPEPPYIDVNWSAVGIIIIIWIVGFLVSFLGTWASAFRISTQLAMEEIRKTMPVSAVPPAAQVESAPVPTCPKCNTPLMYVQQYQRWYCPTCREYR